ncbi:MAG: S41 family peptidase [Bacteroidota bacterium]
MGVQIFKLLLLCCGMHSMLYGQKQLTLEHMQQDFDQLADAYKADHQGLYFYTDTLTAHRKIDSLRSTLKADLDLRSFFNKIAALVALTNEGHTNLSYSRKEMQRLKAQAGFLPFGIFFCGENQDAIIKSVYAPAQDQLSGKKLISINGHPIAQMMQEVLDYVATDGFNTSSAYEWIAWDFPFFYYQMHGLSENFEVELVDISGKKTVQVVPGMDYKSIKARADFHDFLLLNGMFETQAYRVIDDTIAYVTLVTFSGKDDRIKASFERIFTDIAGKGIQHLILDIQRHVGGSEGVENLLASYLFEEPFQKYAAVTAPLSFYDRNKKKKYLTLDKWRLVDGIPQRGDFTLMSDYYSDHDFTYPAQELIYTGKVYVLSSGVTFSGGAEFASMLKMTNRALFIGEEVGGAHQGNVSGTGTSIKLKHSKIRASLPFIHFKMKVDPMPLGKGVIPDHFVPQSWEDVLEGVNSKLAYTLRLIQESKP